MASGDNDLSLSIDLGGTNIRVAVVDRGGAMLQRERQRTLAHLGAEHAMSRLVDAAARLKRAVEGRIAGVGVSLGSPVDPDTGRMYNPPSLPGWDGFSPKRALEESLRLPVHIANDATLGAVGEHAYGIGQGVNDLVYVTVSTGIGGGVIVNGRPVMGMEGFAGELGHISIDRNGRRCNCGGIGCLEALASGTAIAGIAAERLSAGERSVMESMAGVDGVVRSEAVMAAAAQGDPLAKDVVEQFARDLGIGLVNLMHVFNPQMIVLGGGVSQNLHLFFGPLHAAIRSRAMAHLKARVPLVASVLGDDASLLGAAHLVFEGLDRG